MDLLVTVHPQHVDLKPTLPSSARESSEPARHPLLAVLLLGQLMLLIWSLSSWAETRTPLKLRLPVNSTRPTLCADPSQSVRLEAEPRPQLAPQRLESR